VPTRNFRNRRLRRKSLGDDPLYNPPDVSLLLAMTFAATFF
jgi:hypothetical protein